MKFIIIALSFCFLVQLTIAQRLNYEELFGDDWKKAVSYEKENRIWIEPLFAENHISYPVGISVIFPELVRYSALSDKIETALLKTLYVNLGEDYANFSIGIFQIKPSFAESICEESLNSEKLRGIAFKKKSEFADIKEFRKSIVKDLEDPHSEINYLIAFLKICEKNFGTNRMQVLSEVKFLATAYNYGFKRSISDIEDMTDKKFFSTKLIKTEKYPYADISLFWYKQFVAGKQL